MIYNGKCQGDIKRCPYKIESDVNRKLDGKEGNYHDPFVQSRI